MNVVFFDIDGTLIRTGGSGVMALKIAFSEVFALPPPATIDTSGRTDRGLAREFFHAHGIEDSLHNWQRFRDAYQLRLAEQLPMRESSVLPGVIELLDALRCLQHVALGLLTGNTREGARIKLEHVNIFQYFAFGGFGENHPDRDGVARDALSAARDHLRCDVAGDRIWVIGDTPLDIRCARHIGANAIAVATGFCPKQQLADEKPDLLLDDLRQAAQLLEIIGTI